MKIQVIGQDRVGKTSLVRALKGEPVRDKEVSTDGVEMSQPLKNAGKQPWKNAALPKDTTVYHHIVAEYIKKNRNAKGKHEEIIKEFLAKARTGLCFALYIMHQIKVLITLQVLFLKKKNNCIVCFS